MGNKRIAKRKKIRKARPEHNIPQRLLMRYFYAEKVYRQNAQNNNVPVAAVIFNVLYSIIIPLLIGDRESLELIIKRNRFMSLIGDLDLVIYFVLFYIAIYQSWKFFFSGVNLLLPNGPSAIIRYTAPVIRRHSMLKSNQLRQAQESITRLFPIQNKISRINYWIVLTLSSLFPFLHSFFVSNNRQLSIMGNKLGLYLTFNPDENSQLSQLAGQIQSILISRFFYDKVSKLCCKAHPQKFIERLSKIAHLSVDKLKLLDNAVVEVSPSYHWKDSPLSVKKYITQLHDFLHKQGFTAYRTSKRQLYVVPRKISDRKASILSRQFQQQCTALSDMEEKLEARRADLIEQTQLAWQRQGPHLFVPLVSDLRRAKEQCKQLGIPVRSTVTGGITCSTQRKPKRWRRTQQLQQDDVDLPKPNVPVAHIDFGNGIHYYTDDTQYQPSMQRAFEFSTVPWLPSPIYTTVSDRVVEFMADYIDKDAIMNRLRRGQFISTRSSKGNKAGRVGIKCSKGERYNAIDSGQYSSDYILKLPNNLRIFGRRIDQLVVFDGPAWGH